MLTGPWRPAARLRRALSPRGALALHRVDGALSFALRAALAMALSALPMALTGRADQAVYAMLGSFTTSFGRNLPYARRIRVLAVVALAMTACVGGGVALAAWARPRDGEAGAVLTVVATALVAGSAKFACDAARLGGLGAVLLLVSFAVAANGAATPADVLPRTALAAGGAAVAWALAVAGWSVYPDRTLRRQARALVGRRRRAPQILPDLALPVLIAQTGTLARPDSAVDPARASGPAPGAVDPTTLRATESRAAELVTGPAHGRTAVLLVPALRMVLGTGVAGGSALALGLGHGYWAALSAAAVLHSINVRTAAQRAVQRTLGTVVGLLLALGVLALEPRPMALVLVIVLLEFFLEYVVARNYGLGVVFLTPMALLLTDLAAPAPAGTLVQDRALSSVLGVALALGCALAVVHDRAAVRAERALAACAVASERAEGALEDGNAAVLPLVQARLAAAVVELREADDAAAGELWPAEVDPTELAAAERRAYLLLDRLVRRG
ncbi:FUSC family protein [Streptomyces sp. bgisy060]|uniref:FUSC family protein n=1 Tax=Streptomyces sp. bgisy060 TaxID=3413775 RepID=UPI003EC1278F